MKQKHRACVVMAHSAWKLRIAPCFIISEEWLHGGKERTSILLGWQTGGGSVGGRISRIWLQRGEGCLWNIRSKGSIEEAPDLGSGD